MAFLPLMLFLGHQFIQATAGALIELLQKGTDGRPKPPSWTTHPHEAMVRGAAIFAAKDMIPVTMGIMFKALHAVSGSGYSERSKVTPRTGVFLNKGIMEEDRSLKGLPKNLGSGTTFPHDLRVALRSSSGHNLPTPKNSILEQAFKRYFKTKKSEEDLPRQDISYLRP
ncbi:hypothetical protein V8E36_003654 [Tilletia maclaganii]